MVSDPRQAAKRAITVRETDDPELDGALSDGRSLSLELVKENNRHASDMRSKELGYFGQIIGGETTAPTVVALFVVAVGFLGGVGCWVAAGFNPEQGGFWSTQAERGFAVGSAALAFIFGKGSK